MPARPQYGADVPRLDSEGRTSLAFARSAGPCAADVADLLVSAGCPEPPAGTLSRRRGSLTPRDPAASLL